MKNFLKLALVLILAIGLLLSGCRSEEISLEEAQYDNGRYRGIYEDRGEQQVSIQFHLEDGIIYDVSYRHLYHSGNDYRGMEEGDPLYPIVQQHEQILEHLEGLNINDIDVLSNTGDFVDDVDGFSGATIRGSKIYSAMRDGLNRGLYDPRDYELNVRDFEKYDDGRYRGIFADRGYQQVSFQFHLEDNVLSDLSFRHLYHNNNDYRAMEADSPLYPLVEQHEQIIEYLDGKSLEAIYDLHNPGDFVDDIDGFSGATLRANKVFSAIMDGLNRGIYDPRDYELNVRDLGNFEDGRYRGIFGDRGDQQVSIQFHLEDGILNDISYRWLYHGGNDYRAMDANHPLYPIVTQHDQITDYLEGKPLEALFDLHNPGDFVDDVDGFSGATLRANKIFSAMVDALNRGLY